MHSERYWGKTIAIIMLLMMIPAASFAASGDVPVGRSEEMKIKPPLPVWPSDYETTTETRPLFRFNGRFGASHYRVELDRDAAFPSPVVTEKTRVIETKGITPVVVALYEGEPLQDGQYYWRAFAAGDDNKWTPPANYRTFFVSQHKRDGIAAPAEVVHPRLLLSAPELDAFRTRLECSTRLAPGWQYIQNAAAGMLDSTPPDEAYARAASGQHGNYSIVAHWYHRHLANVAFVAFVNNDDRLAAKGVEILMAACAYERWLGPSFDDPKHFDPPWHAALETAMMTTAVATGYDLLYPHLTEDQRARVRQSLVEKGIKPLIQDWADPVTASRLPRHQLPTGNWVMVCSASAGVGALAVLGEHPDAPQWIRVVRDRTRAWLNDRGGDWFVDNPWQADRPSPIPVIGPSEPNFGIDGGYKETVGYMNYAMRYLCCFADGLHRATGEDLFQYFPPKLLDHAAWSILAWREKGEVHQSLIPFGDCGTTAAFPLLYAALAKYRRDEMAAWLGERVVPIPQDIRALVWLNESVPGNEPDTAVPMGVFRDVGQVVMRSGWDAGTPVGAIKFRQNRGHLDIGAFYLFGAGQPTLIDSGSTAYDSAIYKNYSSQSLAHNLVLVDGQPQTRADGQLLAAVGTSQVTAASGQIAAAYPNALQSWTRDLIMLPGNVAIVLDRLAANEPHRFDYLLHPYATHRMPDPIASPGEILIGDEADPTRVRVYSDAKLTATEQDGYYLTSPSKYIRFESPEPSKNRSYLAVCEWPSRNRTADRLNVSSTSPGRWLLRSVSEHRRLIVRTGDEANRSDRTDARLVAVWDQGEKSRERHALVLAGMRLGIDNRELMRATRPIHAAIEFGHPVWAQFWTAAPVQVSLAADVGEDYVFVNGERVDATRRGELLTFDLPAGQSKVVVGDLPRFIDRPRSIVRNDLLAVSASTDAPAFQPGVIARSSSCVPEALLAIDGDANTGWSSLQSQPMPQWMEVDLPAAVAIESIRLETGGPCQGHVEIWDPQAKSYKSAGRFETMTGATNVAIKLSRIETDRIRVVIDEIEQNASTATINTLEWK